MATGSGRAWPVTLGCRSRATARRCCSARSRRRRRTHRRCRSAGRRPRPLRPVRQRWAQSRHSSDRAPPASWPTPPPRAGGLPPPRRRRRRRPTRHRHRQAGRLRRHWRCCGSRRRRRLAKRRGLRWGWARPRRWARPRSWPHGSDRFTLCRPSLALPLPFGSFTATRGVALVRLKAASAGRIWAGPWTARGLAKQVCAPLDAARVGRRGVERAQLAQRMRFRPAWPLRKAPAARLTHGTRSKISQRDCHCTQPAHA